MTLISMKSLHVHVCGGDSIDSLFAVVNFVSLLIVRVVSCKKARANSRVMDTGAGKKIQANKSFFWHQNSVCSWLECRKCVGHILAGFCGEDLGQSVCKWFTVTLQANWDILQAREAGFAA